jgi:hypothetical protein
MDCTDASPAWLWKALQPPFKAAYAPAMPVERPPALSLNWAWQAQLKSKAVNVASRRGIIAAKIHDCHDRQFVLKGKKNSGLVRNFCSVRAEGLEPPCLAAPDPKSGASANFATPASKAPRIYTHMLNRKGHFCISRECLPCISFAPPL